MFFLRGGRGSVNNFVGPVSSLIAKSFKDFALKKNIVSKFKKKNYTILLHFLLEGEGRGSNMQKVESSKLNISVMYVNVKS